VARRRYRLGKRADQAAGTRRRIVEATLSLHDEQGITATSLRRVAARAHVAPSTVLQHFPVMDELIRACGEVSDQLAPIPTDAIFVGAEEVPERVRRMALAMFEWWEQLGPGFDHLRTDRHHVAVVDAWLVDVGRRHREMAATALSRDDSIRTDLLVALTSADAWSTLRGGHADARRAAGRVAQLICQGLTRKESYH
jgi:AcrR family transcriptional regulator